MDALEVRLRLVHGRADQAVTSLESRKVTPELEQVGNAPKATSSYVYHVFLLCFTVHEYDADSGGTGARVRANSGPEAGHTSSPIGVGRARTQT